MKRILYIAALGLLACVRPASAAQIKVLEPQDKTVLRGTVQFRIQPTLAPNERILSAPEIVVQDEGGQELHRVRTVRDMKTGVSSGSFDTKQLKDGLYLLTINYRGLILGKVEQVREDLTVGVRNGAARPARVAVELEERPYRTDETADLTVKVFDQRGMRMPGVRVALRRDKGELLSDAEITDSEGEAALIVDTEEAGNVTLTITIEGLPPVTKVVRFAG